MSFFKSLFKEAGVKNVVTLFHAPSSPASMRVHTILKQASAASTAHPTEDQASGSGQPEAKSTPKEFELDVVEEAPTSDQLNSILEYLGPSKASSVIAEATGSGDALRKFKASPSAFQRPVTVDWNNGKAVVGDNESEILKLINELPK